MRATVVGIENDLIPRPVLLHCDGPCQGEFKTGWTRYVTPRSEMNARLRELGWDVDEEHNRHVCPECRRGSD